MIGQFPLWLVITVWALQRINSSRITIYNYPRHLLLCEDMAKSLPIPVGRVQTWLVIQVLEWIDAEKQGMIFLRNLGAVATVLKGNRDE